MLARVYMVVVKAPPNHKIVEIWGGHLHKIGNMDQNWCRWWLCFIGVGLAYHPQWSTVHEYISVTHVRQNTGSYTSWLWWGIIHCEILQEPTHSVLVCFMGTWWWGSILLFVRELESITSWELLWRYWKRRKRGVFRFKPQNLFHNGKGTKV